MTVTVEYAYSITTYGDYNFENTDRSCAGRPIDPSWESLDGEGVAAQLIEVWSRHMDWGQLTNAVYRVEIRTPERVAGRYVVSCERVPKATAHRESPC